MHTFIDKSDIIEYKEKAIKRNYIVFKPGTSIIESSTEQYKNTTYVTVGFALLWGAVNANYEQMIWKSQDRFIQSLWFRIGAGSYAAWDAEGINFVATLNALTCKKNTHLEFGLGATYFGGDISLITPAGALGYRFQKPKGHFIFRTGIGWPESFYLSFGVCL